MARPHWEVKAGGRTALLIDEQGKIIRAQTLWYLAPSHLQEWQARCWICNGTSFEEDGMCTNCGGGWCNDCGRRVWFDGTEWHHAERPEIGCFLVPVEVPE